MSKVCDELEQSYIESVCLLIEPLFHNYCGYYCGDYLL